MSLSSYRIPFLIPYFAEMQRKSYLNFLNTGLIYELSRKNPMYDSFNHFEIMFYPEYYQLGTPEYTAKTAILKFKTYSSKLYIPLQLKDEKTKQFKLHWIIIGNLPLMTKNGNFIVNGSPRIIVNQIVRSPGIYYKQITNQNEKKTYYGDLISQRGAWLRFEIDSKKRIWVQMKKTRKIPLLIFFKAIGISDFKIRASTKYLDFLQTSKYETEFIEKKQDYTRPYIHPESIDESLLWIYSFVYPEKKKIFVTLKKAKKFLFRKFFSHRTYDLGYTGRNQLNKKFNLTTDANVCVLMAQDLLCIVNYLIKFEQGIGVADDIDDLKNRRVRTTGELIQNQLATGLIRLEKLIKSKTVDATLPILKVFTAKPVDGALKEFFGSSPLSQFMDETNPLAELTHKRRVSSLGPGGVSRETAGMQVRGIHPSHYGRICPIETPEGRNAGLVNSLTTLAQINEQGFIETPFYNVYQSQVQKYGYTVNFSANQEQHIIIAPSDLKTNYFNFLPCCNIPVRASGDFKKLHTNKVQYMSVSPIQMISIATCLIPFLEHDDANRALMGSNMQRQAVPLISAEKPTIGTGLEARIISDSGHGLQAKKSGFVYYTSNKNILVTNFQKNFLKSSASRNLFTLHEISSKKLSLNNNNLYTCSAISMQLQKNFTNVFTYVTTLISCNKNKKVIIHYKKSNLQDWIGFTQTLNIKNINEKINNPILVKKNIVNLNIFMLVSLFSDVLLNSCFNKNLSTNTLYTSKKYLNFYNKKFFKSKKYHTVSFKKLQILHMFASIISDTLQLKKENQIKKNIFIICKIQNNKNFNCNFISLKQKINKYNVTYYKLKTTTHIRQIIDLNYYYLNFINNNISDKHNNFNCSDIHVKKLLNFRELNIGKTFLLHNLLKTKITIPALQFFIIRNHINFTNNCLIVTSKLVNKKLDCLNLETISELHRKTTAYMNLLNYSKFSIKQFLNECIEFCFLQVFTEKKNLAHVFFYLSLHWKNLNINKFAKSRNFKKTKNSTFFKITRFTNLKTTVFSKKITEATTTLNNLSVIYNNVKISKHLKLNQDFMLKKNLQTLNCKYDYLPLSNNVRFQKSLNNIYINFKSEKNLLQPTHVKKFSKKNIFNKKKNTIEKSEFKFFNTTTNYTVLPYQHSNQNTCMHQTSLVKDGEWIQKGDCLADGAASVGGELALGKSILVAYMPWEGYNFEDAILVNERLVYDDIYTSVHIEKYKVEVSDTEYGLEQITPFIPDITDKQLFMLDAQGVVKLGSWVTENDILVGKLTPILKRPVSGHEKLLSAILRTKKKQPIVKDSCLRVPKNVSGRVVHIELLENENISVDKFFHGPTKVHIYVAEKRKLQVGDKMSGRHGNKGIISNILPRQDMPYLPDGTPIDIVLNPLGVPSRMNVGQIFECLLGLAAKQLNEHYRISCFDEMNGPEASRSFTYSKLFQARLKTQKKWLFNPNMPGKMQLFDGRSGEHFHQHVTVGQPYMLKLVHLVDEKIHARSTGPYSLVTQQPLRGKSKHGGQRLGEMEVWALEGFGAAYTLQELLTAKSDDIKGRHQVMQAILDNKSISLGTPESFKVLLSELQSLCLNIGVYSIDNSGIRKKFDIMQFS